MSIHLFIAKGYLKINLATFSTRTGFQVAKQVRDVYFEDQLPKTPPLCLTSSSCHNNIIWRTRKPPAHTCATDAPRVARNANIVAKIRVRPYSAYSDSSFLSPRHIFESRIVEMKPVVAQARLLSLLIIMNLSNFFS